MSVDISVSITEDVVDIIATPTVNIVNVTNSASIDPGLYDLSEFTNTSLNPFVRASNLSSYVPSTRSILTASPLVGGGDLSANRTISIPQATSSVNGFLSSTDWTTFNNKQNALGFTPVPDTRTLTINGVSQDLSADRSWTISTGLTVGTTPISSGTNGRVLFQGTGNVLQQSGNLAWDDTNTGLSILSTTSTSGDRGVLIKQFNTGIQGALSTFQKSRGTIASPTDVAANDLVGLFQFSARVGGTYTSDRAIFGANMATSTGIGLFFSAGSSNGSYIPSLYIHPSGNAVFGSTQSILTGITDAGFRLDVNGTARVLGNVDFGNTSSVASLLTVSIPFSVSAATDLLRLKGLASKISIVFGAGGVQSASLGSLNLGNSYFESGLFFNTASGGVVYEAMRIANTRNVLINTTTDAGFKLDVNGSARVTTLRSDNPVIGFAPSTAGVLIGSNQTYRIVCDGSSYYDFRTSAGIIYRLRDDGSTSFGSTTIAASAMVDIQSTTKGFLPPRQTQAQRTAIASPAVGLIVYQTDLVEGLYIYKSTGWTFVI